MTWHNLAIIILALGLILTLALSGVQVTVYHTTDVHVHDVVVAPVK